VAGQDSMLMNFMFDTVAAINPHVKWRTVAKAAGIQPE
jgi:hypothetical protein